MDDNDLFEAGLKVRREVLAKRADIGIALDGDADRLIVADERGVILYGNQLMARIATGLAISQRFSGGALVLPGWLDWVRPRESR